MQRRIYLIYFWGLLLLALIACASQQVGIRRHELSFKKVDHFIVHSFEVGVLEFEPCILPGGYIPIYHFPIYLEAEKDRDIYVNVYGSPEELNPFRFDKVSKKFLYQQELLWILEEKTEENLHRILKRYDSAPNYPQIKNDVIEILSGRR